jgi:hypothetical protein
MEKATPGEVFSRDTMTRRNISIRKVSRIGIPAGSDFS